MLACFRISALFAAAKSGAAYDWNGLRKGFAFGVSGSVLLKGLMLGDRCGSGLDALVAGRKLSSRT